MTTIDELAFNAKMDVAEQIAAAINRAGINRTQLAEKLGQSKGNISKLLSGDENLQIETIARILGTIGCRFDIVVTPSAANEWLVKKSIAWIEGTYWHKYTQAPVDAERYTPVKQASAMTEESDANGHSAAA